MKIQFTALNASLPADTVVVLFAGTDKKLSPLAQEVNKKTGGALAKAVAHSRFAGKRGQVVNVPLPDSMKAGRVMIAGTGDATSLDQATLQSLGGGLMPHLHMTGAASATIAVESIKGLKMPLPQAAAHIAFGARLRDYRFDKYFTKTPEEEKPRLKTLHIAVANASAASAAFKPYEGMAEGIYLTRNVGNEPANIIYPESFAKEALELKKLGVAVEVLGEAEMKKLGMGSLLGVGQGSERESKLVVMRWNGGAKSEKPLAFIGKGVTFDTGGISIKPANGMEDMKWDMSGAGTVLGLMHTLASRKAKVNVVCVAGLTENMPDGNAQRPGDVVTSMSGQTIEVLNTDAEGRLVLADALWYTQDRFKPQFMINLATLTGAIVVALGTSRAGLFSNNDKLADQLFKTGKKAGEELWRLPLADVYDKQINSDIADMQNIGKDREAGSITAAQFLQRFVNKTPWAHLDIAGVAYSKKPSDTSNKGATAFGVRLLNQLVADFYER